MEEQVRRIKETLAMRDAEVEAELAAPKGRPPKGQTPEQKEARARDRAAKYVRDRRLPTVAPHRCKGCGALLVVENCLTCENVRLRKSRKGKVDGSC